LLLLLLFNGHHTHATLLNILVVIII
jgi:hypothetical protein